MKGLSKERNGRWRLQFNLPNGKRCRINLGCIPQYAAEATARHIHQLVVSRASGAVLPMETAQWLGVASDALIQRLMEERVVDPAAVRPASITLADFLDLYFARPDDRAKRTIAQLKIARKNLLDYFDAHRDLRSITCADAEDFRKWLKRPRGEKAKVWNEATVNRIAGRAKEMFNYAKNRRLIEENPFGHLRGLTVRANSDTQFIVDRELTQAVMDALPDLEWRLIFALARFGGLRCPSEIVTLRWEDILWDVAKINIRCQKTQRYEGRGWRIIPLFPELHDLLREAWERAPEGAEWVITRYRKPTANPGVQLQRILAKAGIPAWPKLFQNLRFTRAVELVDEGYPEHVVQAWIGHTGAVAKKHYRTVRDEHFQRAAQGLGKANPSQIPPRVKSGSTRGHKGPQRGTSPATGERGNPSNPAATAKTRPDADRPASRPNARERT
jgi:integrase